MCLRKGIRVVKKTLLLLSVMALAMLFSSGMVLAQQNPPAPPQGVDDAFVRGEILVKFEPGTPERSRAEAHRQNGGRVEETIRRLGVQVVIVPRGQEQAKVGAYNRNPNVEYAELNGIATISLDPNDPYDNSSSYASSKHGDVNQWARGKIQAYDAWNRTTGSSSVKVAILDTGIDNSHPDLPAAVAQKDFVNNDTNAEDDNGHGTHVAGTIGASTNNTTGVAGTNWSVDLMAVKVLNANGSGSYANIANGIIWAANNGAKVINLSLGGTFDSTTLRNAVNTAWNKSAVLACAAGNSGSSQKNYPGAYTNCIAVGATDENDQKASFSNSGKRWVDTGAPGVHILSTMPNSPVTFTTSEGYYENYDSLNGTSMATPHVADVAGLVWATGLCDDNDPNTKDNPCIRNRIEGGADQIPSLANYWPDGRRLNALESVSP
jgi:thermitase